MTAGRLNVAAVLAPSFANGPGARFVVWVQGCSIRCRGCQNPHLWSSEPKRVVPVNDLLHAYDRLPGLRGITFTGGEPFEQAASLAQLAAAVHARQGDVVAFSGFTRSDLEADVRPHSAALLHEVDLLVDGAYRYDLPTTQSLIGSANQVVHHLTDRIAPRELDELPRLEWIGTEGVGRLTGFGVAARPTFLDAAAARTP